MSSGAQRTGGFPGGNARLDHEGVPGTARKDRWCQHRTEDLEAVLFVAMQEDKKV